MAFNILTRIRRAKHMIYCVALLNGVGTMLLPAENLSPNETPPQSHESPRGRPAVDAAIEAIRDEDEATRKSGLAVLANCGEADLSELEKHAADADIQVRGEVLRTIYRIQRGTCSFYLSYRDAKPVANTKCLVEIYAKSVTQFDGSGLGIVFVYYTDGLDEAGNEILAKPLFVGEVATDSKGHLVAGKFKEDDYFYSIKIIGVPTQEQFAGKVTLGPKFAPPQLTCKRGVTAKITVVDEKGTPLGGAVVLDIEDRPMETLKNEITGWVPSNVFREPGRIIHRDICDAKGIGTLEGMGLGAINLIVAKPGYGISFEMEVMADDGATIAKSFTLKKAKTQSTSVLCKDSKSNLISDLHLVAFTDMDYLRFSEKAVFDGGWEKNLGSYLAAGAIDLGLTDRDGAILVDLPPEYYSVVCLRKNEDSRYYGVHHLELAPSRKVPQVTFVVREIRSK